MSYIFNAGLGERKSDVDYRSNDDVGSCYQKVRDSQITNLKNKSCTTIALSNNLYKCSIQDGKNDKCINKQIKKYINIMIEQNLE